MRCTRIVALVCLCLLAQLAPAATAATVVAQQARNLGTHPPHVLSAVARLLAQPAAGGNALVEINVANDEILPPTIPVELEFGKTTLRDDGKAGDRQAGDRVYSAIVQLDVAAIKRNQERLSALQDQVGKLVMPVYRGRERVELLDLPVAFFKPPSAGSEIPLERWGFPPAINTGKSLLVRHTSVVDDPQRTYDPCNDSGTKMGAWTFGRLMTEIANSSYTGLNPAEFVASWIQLSRTRQVVNTWPNFPFPVTWDEVVEEWLALGGGTLDLAKAPFKLLAIVNRVDLRDNLVYGGSNAGEARFVFGFRRCSYSTLPSALSPPLTVIFEYGISKTGCNPLKNWAQQWTALGDLPLGSPAYLTALEAITDQFSRAGAAPSKPNRSALNQLRINGGQTPGIWEMREFKLQTTGAAVARNFVLTTVKQTPDTRVLAPLSPHASDLTDYVNGATPEILADRHVVPDFYSGRPFISGVADAQPFPLGWNLPDVINREARHKFALATCNGCHLHETGTPDFFHIKPALPGTTAQLSGFMTGIDVPDHFDDTPTRRFDELERRAVDLDGLANAICLAYVDPTQRFREPQLRGPIPLLMTH